MRVAVMQDERLPIHARLQLLEFSHQGLERQRPGEQQAWAQGDSLESRL